MLHSVWCHDPLMAATSFFPFLYKGKTVLSSNFLVISWNADTLHQIRAPAILNILNMANTRWVRYPTVGNCEKQLWGKVFLYTQTTGLLSALKHAPLITQKAVVYAFRFRFFHNWKISITSDFSITEVYFCIREFT